MRRSSRFKYYFLMIFLYALLVLLVAANCKVVYDCGFAKSMLYGKNVGYAWLMGYCKE